MINTKTEGYRDLGFRWRWDIFDILTRRFQYNLSLQIISPKSILCKKMTLTFSGQNTYIYVLKRAIYRPSIGWPWLKTTAFFSKNDLIVLKSWDRELSNGAKIIVWNAFLEPTIAIQSWFFWKKNCEKDCWLHKKSVASKGLASSHTMMVSFWIRDVKTHLLKSIKNR